MTVCWKEMSGGGDADVPHAVMRALHYDFNCGAADAPYFKIVPPKPTAQP